MYRGFVLLVLCFSLLALTACTPVVDGTSDETMKASIEDVRSSLPEGQRAEFNTHIIPVMNQGVDLKDLVHEREAGTATAKARDNLNGLSGEQIIAKGRELKVKREEAAKANKLVKLKEKIASLEKKRDDAKTYQSMLGKVSGGNTDYMANTTSGKVQVRLEIEFQNGTTIPLKGVEFKASLYTGTTLLFDEVGRQAFAEPLGPGKSKVSFFKPDPSKPMGFTPRPKSASLKVEILKLLTTDGKVVPDSFEFTPKDEASLKQAKEDLATSQ